MRMRKIALVLLLVLVSVILFSLVACDSPSDNVTPTPDIPVPKPGDNIVDDKQYIDSTWAWEALKAAALNAGAESGRAAGT